MRELRNEKSSIRS
ncbi:unnamed protein product [Rhodiola kirilowii]